MNWDHLKTVCWLRWRLFQNHLQRSGTLNRVLTTILIVLGVIVSAGMFVLALVLGTSMLPETSATQVLFLWNIVILGFLCSWLAGLFTQLQRSDVISLEKLLSFPLSPSSAFLVNYLTSFFSFTMVLFLPAIVGLAIASVVAIGPSMLILFPLVAGFLLSVTALTYQLRGWLATLMVNKRRRRTIIALITMGFIVIVQVPNLVNIAFMRNRHNAARHAAEAASRDMRQEADRLNKAFHAGEISEDELRKQVQDLSADNAPNRFNEREVIGDVTYWTTLADIVFPPGWLAIGAMSAVDRNVWPGLLGSVGFCLLGGASLRRSYQTTLRFYRGELTSGRTGPDAGKPASQQRKANLLERELRWIPLRAAPVTLANVCSLMRAPEVKMTLLTPFILIVIFGSSLFARGGAQLPESLRPILALGAIGTSMLTMVQLLSNQFGFDRDGFRALVLSPLPRRDILLGKNLALAPIAIGVATSLVCILQIFYPLHLTQFVASLLQLVSVYLICCIVGNYTSILLPTAVPAGSLMATKTTTKTALLHMLSALFVMVALTPVAVPLGLGILSDYLEWWRFLPVYLLLASALLGGVVMLYWLLLTSQGELLQSREQAILDVVTTKND